MSMSRCGREDYYEGYDNASAWEEPHQYPARLLVLATSCPQEVIARQAAMPQIPTTSLSGQSHKVSLFGRCRAPLCIGGRRLNRPWTAASSVRSRRLISAAAAQEVEAGKEISRTGIPAFIPREDLIHQLFGWARIECEESGAVNYGLPMKVRPVYRDDEYLWGFITSIMSRDGANLTDIRVMFDEEITKKHQWVGRGADGFPSLEGNSTDIIGNELIIRKIDDNPLDDQTRGAIRGFCVKLVESLNKYYAFGSCFVDDTT